MELTDGPSKKIVERVFGDSFVYKWPDGSDDWRAVVPVSDAIEEASKPKWPDGDGNISLDGMVEDETRSISAYANYEELGEWLRDEFGETYLDDEPDIIEELREKSLFHSSDVEWRMSEDTDYGDLTAVLDPPGGPYFTHREVEFLRENGYQLHSHNRIKGELYFEKV